MRLLDIDYGIATNSVDKMVREEKNKIRTKAMDSVDELTLSRFFTIVDNCKRSDHVKLEDDSLTNSWDPRIIVDVYRMVNKCSLDIFTVTVKTCILKFGTDKVPINYLTAIFRTNITKRNSKHDLIKSDMDEIRTVINTHCNDHKTLDRLVNEKFSLLNLKINRMDIDRESKLDLMKRVTDNHRRFQEWIQKNLK